MEIIGYRYSVFYQAKKNLEMGLLIGPELPVVDSFFIPAIKSKGMQRDFELTLGEVNTAMLTILQWCSDSYSQILCKNLIR